MIMEFPCSKNQSFYLASRSLNQIEQFTDEVRAVYQYLFNDKKINQLLLDILINIPIGINSKLQPYESFTTFETKKEYIPKEIVLPDIVSSLQSVLLIGESARIMKNQESENIQNEIIVEFLKLISSELISKKNQK